MELRRGAILEALEKTKDYNVSTPSESEEIRSSESDRCSAVRPSRGSRSSTISSSSSSSAGAATGAADCDVAQESIEDLLTRLPDLFRDDLTSKYTLPGWPAFRKFDMSDDKIYPVLKDTSHCTSCHRR